jgi:6-phosphogluconolactonase
MIRSSILSIVALSVCGLAHTREHIALLGTYTGEESRGIYAVQLDAETGVLSTPELVAELPSPEFLALHPNGKVVYALTRVDTDDGGASGAVAAFGVDPKTGKLTPLNVQSTGNSGSLAHLGVDATGRTLVAASYGGGYVVSFPIAPDGRLGERASFLVHKGQVGPNQPRQDAPHPHSVTLSPDVRFAFVADLALDRVFAYQLDPENGTITPYEPGLVSVAPGAGPRHTKFSPDGKSFYVLDELDCTITSCTYDVAQGIADPFQVVSTLPDDFSGRNTTSEIRVHPSGRFVYAANRGHDSLAVFARDTSTGALTRVEIVACGGERPRNFALTPDGAWLLCAHQDSNTATAFKVDPTTGRLSATGQTVAVPKAVCVLFLE